MANALVSDFGVCSSTRIASSLLDLKLGGGADGPTPLCHEVLASWHHVPVEM